MPIHHLIITSFFILASSFAQAGLSSETSGDDQRAIVDERKQKSSEPQFVIKTIKDLFSLFSKANQFYSYRSLLTYEANGYITTYQLTHWLDNKTVFEQLLFLDGPPREVVRKQGYSHCNVGEAHLGVWSIPQPNTRFSAYTLKVIGMERVASRQAIIFEIMPKDEFRYGYRYSIDKNTGLILKVITYEKGKIIERLQTVSIELIDDPSLLDIVDDGSTYIWRVPELEPCQAEQFQPGWQVGWLPKGFKPVGNRLTAQSEQVLIFTDGLVSISVFITNKPFDTLKKATARHGATVLVVSPMASAPGRSVAVVGELPTNTARKIALSVGPNE